MVTAMQAHHGDLAVLPESVTSPHALILGVLASLIPKQRAQTRRAGAVKCPEPRVRA